MAPGLGASRALGGDPVIRRIRTSPTRPVAEAVVGNLTGVRNPIGQGDRVLGFATEPTTSGWTFIIDDSESSVFADARRTLAIELGVLGLLVALGIAGALVLGRRLTRQYSDARDAEERVRRLQEITAGVSAASTPADVARVVLERGRDATGAAAGSVALIDEDGTTITTLMLVGYSDAVEPRVPVVRDHRRAPTPHSIREGPVWLRAAPPERHGPTPTSPSSTGPCPTRRSPRCRSWSRATRSAGIALCSPTAAPSARTSGRS